MNTIRQLCDRCVVLDKGRIIYDGDVEEAIDIYMGSSLERNTHNDFTERKPDPYITADVKINFLDVLGEDNLVKFGEKFAFELQYDTKKQLQDLCFRFTILKPDRNPVATSTAKVGDCEENGSYRKRFALDIAQLAPGDYQIQIVAFQPDRMGGQVRHDYIASAVYFTVYSVNQLHNFEWNAAAWGNQALPDAEEI
jgi:lipopolysaccharide transport system ATP-binding protein